jgi:hypothetical protein
MILFRARNIAGKSFFAFFLVQDVLGIMRDEIRYTSEYAIYPRLGPLIDFYKPTNRYALCIR